MQKTDYIYMIADNIMVYQINLPTELQGDKLHEHLNIFDEKYLKIVAGFDKNFLEHFLIISKGKKQEDFADVLEKMEQISLIISPTGNLSYLHDNQIQYILTKLGSFKANEIKEEVISKIADEQIEKEFGAGNGSSTTLENQLSSAAFYLQSIGYNTQEIKEKFNEVRQDPSKLDTLFTLKVKEIMSVPPEIQRMSNPPSGGQSVSSARQTSSASSSPSQNHIEHHIQSIQHEVTGERAKKVVEIMGLIKAHVKEKMTANYERVFRQIHPDRLNRAFKMLKTTKRKSKRMDYYLEWFFSSTLLSKIELKVEHWQVSSQATQGTTGVYTAGIDFSRYDPIIREFPDAKLGKVITIIKRILQTPSKDAIQKLGQSLISETGFDEHLYFTD